jgi:hypothetical protein
MSTAGAALFVLTGETAAATPKGLSLPEFIYFLQCHYRLEQGNPIIIGQATPIALLVSQWKDELPLVRPQLNGGEADYNNRNPDSQSWSIHGNPPVLRS